MIHFADMGNFIAKYTSHLFLRAYQLLSRLKAKGFSVLVAGSFGKFGSKSILVPPIRLGGESRIIIGNRVFIGARSWIQTLHGCSEEVSLVIGDETRIAGSCVISAAYRITIEDNVLIASNVCIVDHIHRYEDPDKPISSQGIDKVSPIVIQRNTWVGQNVVILPGVTIGKNCVIGANSVVNRSIPSYSVAAGIPAKVVKKI
jgi:acetyltransferase-like isoleucine patch superfamily enzyme